MKFIKIQKNPSYLASLKLGMKFGVWMAPTSALRVWGADFAMIFAAIGNWAVAFAAWIVGQATIVGAGVLGYATAAEQPAEKAEG